MKNHLRQAPAPAHPQDWEHCNHEADIGVHGWGASPADAFAQAALALTAVVTDPETVLPKQRVSIQCAATDLELLLPDWLNVLIYEMATRNMLFSRFQVEIKGTHLTANAWGEPVDRGRHCPAVEVKGATYTELRVWQDDTGPWHARCVVDV